MDLVLTTSIFWGVFLLVVASLTWHAWPVCVNYQALNRERFVKSAIGWTFAYLVLCILETISTFRLEGFSHAYPWVLYMIPPDGCKLMLLGFLTEGDILASSPKAWLPLGTSDSVVQLYALVNQTVVNSQTGIDSNDIFGVMDVHRSVLVLPIVRWWVWMVWALCVFNHVRLGVRLKQYVLLKVEHVRGLDEWDQWVIHRSTDSSTLFLILFLCASFAIGMDLYEESMRIQCHVTAMTGTAWVLFTDIAIGLMYIHGCYLFYEMKVMVRVYQHIRRQLIADQSTWVGFLGTHENETRLLNQYYFRSLMALEVVMGLIWTLGEMAPDAHQYSTLSVEAHLFGWRLQRDLCQILEILMFLVVFWVHYQRSTVERLNVMHAMDPQVGDMRPDSPSISRGVPVVEAYLSPLVTASRTWDHRTSWMQTKLNDVFVCLKTSPSQHSVSTDWLPMEMTQNHIHILRSTFQRCKCAYMFVPLRILGVWNVSLTAMDIFLWLSVCTVPTEMSGWKVALEACARVVLGEDSVLETEPIECYLGDDLKTGLFQGISPWPREWEDLRLLVACDLPGIREYIRISTEVFLRHAQSTCFLGRMPMDAGTCSAMLRMELDQACVQGDPVVVRRLFANHNALYLASWKPLVRWIRSDSEETHEPMRWKMGSMSLGIAGAEAEADLHRYSVFLEPCDTGFLRSLLFAVGMGDFNTVVVGDKEFASPDDLLHRNITVCNLLWDFIRDKKTITSRLLIPMTEMQAKGQPTSITLRHWIDTSHPFDTRTTFVPWLMAHMAFAWKTACTCTQFGVGQPLLGSSTNSWWNIFNLFFAFALDVDISHSTVKERHAYKSVGLSTVPIKEWLGVRDPLSIGLTKQLQKDWEVHWNPSPTCLEVVVEEQKEQDIYDQMYELLNEEAQTILMESSNMESPITVRHHTIVESLCSQYRQGLGDINRLRLVLLGSLLRYHSRISGMYPITHMLTHADRARLFLPAPPVNGAIHKSRHVPLLRAHVEPTMPDETAVEHKSDADHDKE